MTVVEKPLALIEDVALVLALAPGAMSPPDVALLLETAGVASPDAAKWNGAKLMRALAGKDLGPVRVLRRGADTVTGYVLPHDHAPDVLTRALAKGRLERFHAAVLRVLPSPDYDRYGYSYGTSSGFARHDFATRDLRYALATGSTPAMLKALQGLSKYDPAEAAFQLASGMPGAPPKGWLDVLPDPLVHAAARVVARNALLQLGPRKSTWFAYLDSRHEGAHVELAILHAASGDPEPNEGLAYVDEMPAEACLAHLLAHDFDACIARGRAETSSTKKRRDAFMRNEHAAAYIAACLVAGKPADQEHVRGVVSAMFTESSQPPVGLAGMLHALRYQESRQSEPAYHWRWWIETAARSWASLFYLGLAGAWTSVPKDRDADATLTELLRELSGRARASGYATLADELTGCERRIGTGVAAPDSRLANRLRTREIWETALDRLEAGVMAIREVAKKETPKLANDRVLGFTVLVWSDVDRVEIVPWTRPTRSRTGATKNEAVAKLLTSEAAFITEQDRKVLTKAKKVAAARGRTSGFEIGVAALPELVGHPYVTNARNEPLDVVQVEPTLRVRDGKEHYVVEFSPSHVVDGVAYGETAEGRLEVALVDEGHATLAAATSRGGIRVPKSGSDRLAEVLATVGARIRVEGFGAKHDLVAHAQDVDGRIHVLLFRVDREGLRVALRVRPLGADGPAIAPGTGASTVLGSRDGRPVRAERDLVTEREAVQRLCDTSPILAGLPLDGSDFGTGDLESSLEVLLALGEAHDVVLEWPEGDALSPPTTAGKRPFVVRASGKHDWFDVKGELVLDDATVVDMQELLAARARSTGRFVTLDAGRFLALTEGLRKQLDALAKTVDREGKKMRMHPLVLHAIEESIGLDVRADGDARAKLDRIRNGIAARTEPPRGLEAELRDYQREGFSWLAALGSADAGAILADDMGLGKTVQALALLLHRRRGGPSVVVAPTSVVAGWIDQGRRFAPALRFIDLATVDRESAIAKLGPSDVLVATYGLLVNVTDALAKVRIHTLVFDEAQALKNSGTQRTQAARALNADFRVALSGTPIENHLVELYSLVDVVLPGMLGAERDFERRYAAPIRGGDRATLGLLRSLVRPFILRRTKAQVLEELPARTELIRKVAPSDEERAFYEALRRQAVATIDSLDGKGAQGRMRVLAEINRLRRAATDPRLVEPRAPAGAKLAELRELLQEIRAIGHRVLVFGQYLDALASVRADLDAAGVAYHYLDGSTPAKDRAASVAAFQDGDGDVFLISLKAGGTGLNLTGADYVVLMDPWWNPAVEDQAADRVHRIGQTRAVTVVRLVTAGTIEESILAMHGDKRTLAADVLEGMETAKSLDMDAMRALLRG